MPFIYICTAFSALLLQMVVSCMVKYNESSLYKNNLYNYKIV